MSDPYYQQQYSGGGGGRGYGRRGGGGGGGRRGRGGGRRGGGDYYQDSYQPQQQQQAYYQDSYQQPQQQTYYQEPRQQAYQDQAYYEERAPPQQQYQQSRRGRGRGGYDSQPKQQQRSSAQYNRDRDRDQQPDYQKAQPKPKAQPKQTYASKHNSAPKSKPVSTPQKRSTPRRPRPSNAIHTSDIYDILHDEIADRMEDLGYGEESTEQIQAAIQDVDQYFMDTVASLIVEICSMDGVISPVISTDLSNKSAFYKAVFSFVASIGFPYSYPKGAAEFDASELARLQLMTFLVSELQSCKMIGPQEPNYDSYTTGSTSRAIQLNATEKLMSKYLGNTCNTLSVECPESAVMSVQNIQQQIKTVISKLSDGGKGFIGEAMRPLLSPKQYDAKMLRVLELLNEEFSKHYSLRKNVLRKRMEVTIESMLESDRAKQQKAIILKGLNQRLSALDTESGDLLDLDEEGDEDDDEEGEGDEGASTAKNDSDEKKEETPRATDKTMEERSAKLPIWIVFAAHKDIFRNDTVTCITSDIESDVRKVTIGPVPDRGGRADEVRQIEIDNIPFSAFGRGRGGRGRGRGRGRGGGGRGGGYRGGGG
eukprot:CAMPEP_0202692264 /NCGR_PEP_ID=MMETSP1385-20130828/6682_1 /ASSEMBLY_ACC=CAM_ASM_000861 /TAXON_ID=933848 /ORGANISM="Elphidium margaritaceum" /LENGTH=593 /DNA_ID=CAMNT_0049347759 /DNA_START=48 /DNA_END=1825 /DNA_ORIENTATION=-